MNNTLGCIANMKKWCGLLWHKTGSLLLDKIQIKSFKCQHILTIKALIIQMLSTFFQLKQYGQL